MKTRLVALGLFLAACSTSRAHETTAIVEPGTIPGEEARRLVASGARLLDVRAPQFFAGGHIEGAINIPAAEVAARAAELGPRDTPIVVYCRTGTNSARVAGDLRRLGFTRVYDLGSYLNWGEGAPAATPLPAQRAP